MLLIGHNPGLQKLALVLASRGVDLPKLKQKFPTGALATLVVGGDSWAALRPGDAELVEYVVPRQLGWTRPDASHVPQSATQLKR